jgi:hypothetical protein
MNITNLYIMKDYSKQIEELQQFINDRLIITENENDYVLCSDIHFFINENKDYKDVINYWAINKTFKLYDSIYKKTFKGTMNFVGIKWKNLTIH